MSSSETAKKNIDISGYNISKGNFDYLKSYIWYEMVDAFHVYSLGAITKGDKTITLTVDYLLNASEFQKYYSASMKTADNMTSDLVNSSISSLYKALLVHDRLISYCQYYENTALRSTLAGALADGAAVCSGYARAYKYLLNKLGIPCSLCQSDSLNHEWNIVTINGQRYHVDTTWDDPSPDRFGQVRHKNFMLSTKTFKSQGHNVSDFDSSPVSETYDSAYWQNSETEFQYKNGKIYYFDTKNKELCSYGNQREKLLSVKDIWYSAESIYTKSYVCLDSDSETNSLFYSTPDTVYEYSLSTGKSTAYYTPPKPASGFHIYGFMIDDGYFFIDQYYSSEINERGTYSFKYDYMQGSLPAAPEITVSNVAKSGKIKVSWNTVSGASSYNVYRSTSLNGTYKLMKKTTSTSFINTSATAGKTYYYKVCSVNSKGTEGGFSGIKSITCDLARPEVTASNNASTGKVTLTWEKVDGAVSYRVYRSLSKDGIYTLMKTTDSLSYTNTSANAGTTYYYKVKAVAEKSSADSAYSSVVTRTCDLPRPTVSISLNSSGRPSLKWNRINGAVSYKIYRSTDVSGEYKLIKTTDKTSFVNTSFSKNTTYYYKVKAVCSKSNGNSAYSSVVSIKVK